MVHSRAERLQNIEKRLEDLTKIVIQRQTQNKKDLFIDDEEFQYIMAFCSGTARYWRDLNIIEYSQINGKIVYTIDAVIKMLEEQFRALKKK
ncbi:hypothetical protein LNP27_09525 [Flavobacterium galactosidilyticum]|uniref:hypothetical protein n=1 Tax=Flavobacterium galactosidilyticum TaxID=2893886 RepID=UPI001E50B38F|nr:hypothetical protein [Flavobacterium sp. F-340]UFH45373.1 hypothetical protein LNP27_09525 [Flavobacterium sp. F-340]